MEKLTHGGDLTSAQEQFNGEILDFSANINPLGMPKSAKLVLAESIESFANYPDPLCRKLVNKLAEKEEVNKELILCGNGSADLIFRLVWAIRPRCALIIEPTFSEYAQALASVGCKINTYQLQEKEEFMLIEGILTAVNSSTDVVFICNPNNPTGQIVPQELLMRLLARCSACGALLVVDECFLDFLEPEEQNSMVYLAQKFPNLLILKAFTKIYAMPGLRLGYCICGNHPLMQRISDCGQPWSVSQPAQIAGLAALNDVEYIEKTKNWIHEERAFCKKSIESLGLKVIGSHANFIFFKLSKEMPLKDLLGKYGILIRCCNNFSGLSELYYRAAVKSHEDNLCLISALKKIIIGE